MAYFDLLPCARPRLVLELVLRTRSLSSPQGPLTIRLDKLGHVVYVVGLKPVANPIQVFQTSGGRLSLFENASLSGVLEECQWWLPLIEIVL